MQRYTGENALRYEEHRRTHPKWSFEERTVAFILGKLSGQLKSVIDAPVGSGRFLSLYDCWIIGFELSKDMLAVAKSKGVKGSYRIHDLVSKPLSTKADLVVSVRFLNLLPTDQALKALSNLLDAAKQHIIFTVRTVSDIHNGPMNIGPTQIHRNSEILKVLDEHKFTITQRFCFEDEEPGNYDIIWASKADHQPDNNPEQD